MPNEKGVNYYKGLWDNSWYYVIWSRDQPEERKIYTEYWEELSIERNAELAMDIVLSWKKITKEELLEAIWQKK